MGEDAATIVFPPYTSTVTNEEKAFGIVKIKLTIGIILRNWLTYKLREEVMLFERRTYH